MTAGSRHSRRNGTTRSTERRLERFAFRRRAHASACACPRRLKPPLYANRRDQPTEYRDRQDEEPDSDEQKIREQQNHTDRGPSERVEPRKRDVGHEPRFDGRRDDGQQRPEKEQDDGMSRQARLQQKVAY